MLIMYGIFIENLNFDGKEFEGTSLASDLMGSEKLKLVTSSSIFRMHRTTCVKDKTASSGKWFLDWVSSLLPHCASNGG